MPTMFLIDADGKMIDYNVSIADLQEYLEKKFIKSVARRTDRGPETPSPQVRLRSRLPVADRYSARRFLIPAGSDRCRAASRQCQGLIAAIGPSPSTDRRTRDPQTASSRGRLGSDSAEPRPSDAASYRLVELAKSKKSYQTDPQMTERT